MGSHVQVVVPHRLLCHLCPFRIGSEGRFHVSGRLWTLPAVVTFFMDLIVALVLLVISNQACPATNF